MNSKPTQNHILAWARLIKASALVLAQVEADLKAAGFPPLSWYDVLLELRRAETGRLRPHEIESRLLIAQHNVSRLIDRLEKAGYAAREVCEEDGRGAMVAITGAGRKLLRGMWPAYKAAISRHVGQKLSDPAARDLARILGGLLPAPPPDIG